MDTQVWIWGGHINTLSSLTCSICSSQAVFGVSASIVLLEEGVVLMLWQISVLISIDKELGHIKEQIDLQALNQNM